MINRETISKGQTATRYGHPKIKMSDTRCADPDLQLDVDVMILEYTLYHAIKSQFGLLSIGCRDATQTTEANRLLTIFDRFINHFNRRHPAHPKSNEFYSNLDMLEFLVLLSNRSSTTTTTEFSRDTRNKLRSVSVENLASRRRWLGGRGRYARRLSKQPATSKDNVLRDVEDRICRFWNRNRHDVAGSSQHRPSQSQSMTVSSPSLFDLLPRFMTISAEMSATLNLPPNETWMHVACEFMLQASLESLGTHPHASIIEEDKNVLPRLDDCFAWGYVDPRHLIPDDDGEDVCGGGGGGRRRRRRRRRELDEKTQLVNDLFTDPDSVVVTGEEHDNVTTDPVGSGREDPEWTQIRSQWLSEFSIPADASERYRSSRLDRLIVKFPLEKFLPNLVTFMQNVWDQSCEELDGKPILAQIEQGHIKSLGVEGDEFEEFLSRVGLGRKKSSPEILTFDGTWKCMVQK
ncbi:uncharacterized protein PV06_04447 [Exophiala oligosperma]|uniref:Uncharacterized protein n=1 Tax=Exophiala oligosperma TaxID=215243 RepID=A0A0D2DLM9_9EURO|nr:uncharacterized protein PV06_04447 [Exophiala oligosperma]KIW43335.1 hypothetical protein PV06_04447 [Exophiala oligosperma]